MYIFTLIRIWYVLVKSFKSLQDYYANCIITHFIKNCYHPNHVFKKKCNFKQNATKNPNFVSLIVNIVYSAYLHICVLCYIVFTYSMYMQICAYVPACIYIYSYNIYQLSLNQSAFRSNLKLFMLHFLNSILTYLLTKNHNAYSKGHLVNEEYMQGPP